MKLYSEINIPPLRDRFSLADSIMMLGSCFADSIGTRMREGGFRVMVNPFGTLYNPASLLQAVKILDSGDLFTEADCVEMGAGAGRICSFRHHTSFARATAEEFLSNANAKLLEARDFWKGCNRVVLTLGTSFVWYHEGVPVANCLKRPAAEFQRRMLSVEESSECIGAIACAHPEKKLLLTVSPIRHLSDGAHTNTISKARLQLASDGIPLAEYFPAYELLLDELRDYRFYSEDLVHPTQTAVTYIWERFLESAVEPSDLPAIRQNEKAARLSAHRPNLI